MNIIDRKPIYNARGERMFDVIRTDKKVYIETYQKGRIKRITLADETYKVYMALRPQERIVLFEQMKNLMAQDMSLA